MTKNDWYAAGEQIRQIVQDAVDSKDFTELSSSIASVVDSTVNELQSALRDAVDGGRQKYQHTNKKAADQIRRNMEEKRQREAAAREEAQARQEEKRRQQEEARQQRRALRAARKTPKPVDARIRVPGEMSGNIMAWLGCCLGGAFGLALLIILSVGFAVRNMPFVMIPALLLGMASASSFFMAVWGSRRVGLAHRFRRYQEILGERTYCLIEELASAAGKSCRFVRRDLRKMIREGYFREGYLDRKATFLITDQETYQQYLSSQTEYERRQAMEKAARKTAGKAAKASREGAGEEPGRQEAASEHRPEYEELMAEGKGYIRHIRACNERIPGQEMSDKLDRLELVITRIFREAEKDPEVVGELKKLMSYYLPTTKKLLDAYCELDEQPIQGQNIGSTKREIENALDTINGAFENLLDSLFQETAWDISSDITVLHTMLAQEGLTNRDFEKQAAGAFRDKGDEG